MDKFSLEAYLNNGVDKIVKGILRASRKDPGAAFFMLQHQADSRRAGKRREAAELTGEHIPPFLIASITTQCNLHCRGCYARANNCCADREGSGLMTAAQWDAVFAEAEELGVEFILLAGGEPFVRRDVLEMAGARRRLLFPIFTNGTMIDEAYLELLGRNRNLLPVLSLEGNEQTTDERRGDGVYQKLQETMGRLQERRLLFGASVTVTKQNLEEVLSEEFVEDLGNRGVRAIVYVEYVPMEEGSEALAPDEADRKRMNERLAILREMPIEDGGLVLIAFPGDELASGGCLAAGRGFFHINAYGGAEPCPFSPYSDSNVRESSLREALHSSLFRKLQESGSLTEEHTGGCVLFSRQREVEQLLTEGRKKQDETGQSQRSVV